MNLYNKERTLVFIKPGEVEWQGRKILRPNHPEHPYQIFDEIQRKLRISSLEDSGKLIFSMRIDSIPRTVAELHYSVHRGKDFYFVLVDSIAEKPTILAIFEGQDIVQRVKTIIGKTDPADPFNIQYDTIRALGKYTTDTLVKSREGTIRVLDNVVHTSDSLESADFEIQNLLENVLKRDRKTFRPL